jgi:hypothetical protein
VTVGCQQLYSTGTTYVSTTPLLGVLDTNHHVSHAGFRIRIRINLSCWIRIRIQIADPDPGGKKLPTKIEKSTEFSCFEVLDVIF